MAEECDVLVVGAGVAGGPAAVAAARAGASVLVVERRDSPGGAGVSALHQSICGLYAGGDNIPAQPINGGITAEICERLATLSPNAGPTRAGRTYVLPYSADHLASVYAEMTANEQGIRALYDSTVVGVELSDGAIRTVTVRRGDDDIVVKPRTVIDCSGTGTVLDLAGIDAETAPLGERQLAGFTVLLSGVSDFDEALPVKTSYALRAAAESGSLPHHLRFSSVRGGPAGVFLKLSLPPGDAHGRRARAVHDVGVVCRVLAETLPEFADADIADAAEEVMDRDGRRLQGEYTLTAGDVAGARKFDDAAARGAWPMEFWDQETGPSYRYVPDGDWYEIPLRCLQSNTVENLLCAGRCISASSEALASTRVMGICMALGAAAGTHAAAT